MKIAVCSENGEVFQHFGHTPEFLLCDVEDGKITKTETLSSGGTGHGALALLLAESKADVLLCGGIGGGAMNALAQAGIKTIGGVEGNSLAAVEAFLAGTLATREDFRCSHHHHEEGEGCHDHGHTCGGGGHTCGGNCHH